MAEGSICRKCFRSYVCEQFNEHRDSDWDNKKCHFFNDHFVDVENVVEVVRCKDCEHYHTGKESTVCDYDYCDILYYCDGSHRTACEEDFCAYGKKRSETNAE